MLKQLKKTFGAFLFPFFYSKNHGFSNVLNKIISRNSNKSRTKNFLNRINQRRNISFSISSSKIRDFIQFLFFTVYLFIFRKICFDYTGFDLNYSKSCGRHLIKKKLKIELKWGKLKNQLNLKTMQKKSDGCSCKFIADVGRNFEKNRFPKFDHFYENLW